MALDASEIVVAGTGAVYRAPVGTSAPNDVGSALSSSWVELGYVTEDGTKLMFERSTENIMGWQSYQPLRTIVTEIPIGVEAALLQWNTTTVKTALGGGTFDATSTGVKYEPPVESFVDEFALVIEATDQYDYRFVFPRVMVTDTVELAFVRSEPAALPLKMSVLAAPDGGKSFAMFSNDPAFEADASA